MATCGARTAISINFTGDFRFANNFLHTKLSNVYIGNGLKLSLSMMVYSRARRKKANSRIQDAI